MTEFDFDELDKAVNSLMSPNKKNTDSAQQSEKSDEAAGTQPPTQSPKSNPDAVVAAATRQVKAASRSDAPAPATVPEISPQDVAPSTIPDDSQNASEPEKQASPSSEAEPQSVTPPVQASLATKRRGQFMDMKHPSASMKANSNANTPISRSGVTIAPPSATPAAPKSPSAVVPEPVVAPEKTPSAPTADDESLEPEASSPSSEMTEEPAEESAEPSEQQQESPAAEDSREDDQDEHQAVFEVAGTVSDDTDTPNSPFLPGAKVVKRPLGGAAPTGPADLPELGADGEVKLEQPSSDIEPATTQTASALPKELHESVMKVESDTTTAEPNSQEKADSGTSEQAATSQNNSIPQQYQSKAGSGSDDTTEPTAASLYDSPGVPADMPTMPKKKSHLAVVAAIIGLILVGGAVGAVVYLVQTGSL